MEWSLFRAAMISSAVESWERKRLGMAAGSEKRTPWRNQNVKKAFRENKDAFKALLQNRSSTELQSQHFQMRKTADLAVKMSKERSKEEFFRQLDSNYSSAKKVFWQTICRLRGKNLSTTTSTKDSTRNILRQGFTSFSQDKP